MNLLWIILTTMLFSVFFSGMEIAFISANRLRLELDKKHSAIHSNLISLYTQNPGQFVATMMLGNVLTMVIYGLAFAKLLEPVLLLYIQSKPLILLCQTIVSALIILLTAEFIPKMLFRINPNGVLRFFAVPVAFWSIRAARSVRSSAGKGWPQSAPMSRRVIFPSERRSK